MIKKFYTRTLAKLYADQGYYDDAERAYQELVDSDPGNGSLLSELEAIQKLKHNSDGEPDLKSLFSEWVVLVKKAKQIRCI